MSTRTEVCLDRVHSRMVDEIAQREYGMSGLVLMENAGRGSAELLRQAGISGEVIICCGAGNNAGDGFVAARHLANAGISVVVWMSADPERLSADARSNYEILAKSTLRIERLAGAPRSEIERRLAAGKAAGTWRLVDSLLGTGAIGPPRPPIEGWIEAMNGSGLPIVALDLPSGLDCDTGQIPGACIRAAETHTLVAPKPGFLLDPGRKMVGKVRVIDIGIPKEIRIRVEGLQRRAGGIDFVDA